MVLPAITDGTSAAPAAAAPVALVSAGGAPRHAGLVILSFATGNYSKWCIYMRASLGRSGYLGHIDGTVAAAPTNDEWATADYTVLNHLHAAIDKDVADMILAGVQTARQLWLATRHLFTANKVNKAIYLDNDVVSKRGIEPNPEKTSAVMRTKRPTCLVDAQKLPGRVAALSRFIPRLGDKATPLYRLLKKSESFDWTNKARKALEELQNALRNAPILAAPLPQETMLLHVAVSNRA
ncbi:hypothetical protein QYE76_008353 [Lolium multiflorum]|uniref:DUF4219 domain-containing protein n=1 Tax=Lolium multiflorum TaxID=4521 RepID=A0AAD8QH81_LOLMU|nr:hypothetical protein QYE76_008353 [Lolium multiflorum]